MAIITNLIAREVLDSRGNPTVEAEVTLKDGVVGVGISPSGASTGSLEALELRDNDPLRYKGKGVLKAVSNINDIISKEIIGMNSLDQRVIDKSLIALDSTSNKSNLGANTILAVSMAVLNASAKSERLMVCEYLNPHCKYMPVPMMNIINGGAHADNGIDFQELMIMPLKASSFKEALRCGVEIFHTLKTLLKQYGCSTNIGDEGGFAPDIKKVETALQYIIQAIELAGYEPGEEVMLSLDIAATELYENGQYFLKEKQKAYDSSELIKLYENLNKKYPIFSIEDAMAENDEKGWELLSHKFNNEIQLVGDDVFVTNIQLLRKAVVNNIANAILIKPNQIGTITETLDVVNFAHEKGYKCVISHRSGETEDVTISHLAVATGAKQIKTGSLCRVDRTAKYNELIRIEERLKNEVSYPDLLSK